MNNVWPLSLKCRSQQWWLGMWNTVEPMLVLHRTNNSQHIVILPVCIYAVAEMHACVYNNCNVTRLERTTDERIQRLTFNNIVCWRAEKRDDLCRRCVLVSSSSCACRSKEDSHLSCACCHIKASRIHCATCCYVGVFFCEKDRDSRDRTIYAM